MSNTRQILPSRRHCETFVVPYKNEKFHVSAGYYDSRGQRLGEIFIAGSKSGADFDGVCRDGAVLISLALQHGVDLKVVRDALTRNSDGTPSTILGSIIDELVRQQASR